MRRSVYSVLIGALGCLGGCATGHEPNGCGSDLHVAVDGGAAIRFEWNTGCDGTGLSEPYRERPLSPAAP
jgi:hypothetical protein